MTPNQKAKLAIICAKKGQMKSAVLIACQASVENGTVWVQNAQDVLKDFLTPHQFAGYLSVLAKDGLYKPYHTGEQHSDRFFGRLV